MLEKHEKIIVRRS